MSFADWIKDVLLGPRPSAIDRRRHERFTLSAGLELVDGDAVTACRIDNVSAGGVRLVPGADVQVGATVQVRDPATGMSVDGEVVGCEAEGTRVRFFSEDAGIIVSTWLRVAEDDGDEEQASEPEAQRQA